MTQEQIEKFQQIKEDHSAFKIWEHLDNGCAIATMGYSEENIPYLLTLLKSFDEQYGEENNYETAAAELALYEKKGKLFTYLDENGTPVSMNGCTYNEENDSVEFFSTDGSTPSNLYFYGLSTVPEYRGKGACTRLIHYAINFAKGNNYAKANSFDYVYARTDLINSNSEWLMAQAGMEVCKEDGYIIAEPVDVTKTQRDNRLHMWLPLREGIGLMAKENALFAEDTEERKIVTVDKPKVYQLNRK